MSVGRPGKRSTTSPIRLSAPTSAGPATRECCKQPVYRASGLNICTTLYGQARPTVTLPVFNYNHNAQHPQRRVPVRKLGDRRHQLLHGHEQLSGELQERPLLLGLRAGVRMGDARGRRRQSGPDSGHPLRCERRSPPGEGGPVYLDRGPDGNIYYVDFNGGNIVKFVYGLNAIATASPTYGSPFLCTVNFDGSGSVPAQPGDTLSYAGTSTATAVRRLDSREAQLDLPRRAADPSRCVSRSPISAAAPRSAPRS